MIDARKIFSELQKEAEGALRGADVEARLDDARRIARDVRERVNTDPKTQAAAVGVGGLLLAGLLGTRGGRGLVGGVAKTGVVAALGALAYKAWNERQAGPGAAAPSEADIRLAGFPTRLDDDPVFADAILRAMLASAYADGHLDAEERGALDGAFERAGATPDERVTLLTPPDEAKAFDLIAAAAKSPNHAAELYAAATVMAQEPNQAEAAFLARLADRLGIHANHASAMNRAAQ